MNSLPVLSNEQIANMCSKMPSFGGCILDKELNKVVLKQGLGDVGWFVLYLPLEGNQNTVGHWVLLWSARGKEPVFFDPFGMPPSKHILKLIGRLNRIGRGKTFQWNKVELEDVRAESCGYWCLSAFFALSTGHDLSDFTKEFTGYDGTANEQLLSQIFARGTFSGTR